MNRRTFLITVGACLLLASAGPTLQDYIGPAVRTVHADESSGPLLRSLTPFGSSILHGVGASGPSTTCVNVVARACGADLIDRPEWAGSSKDLLAKLDGWLSGPQANLVVLHTATHDLDRPVEAAAFDTQAVIQQIQAQWGSQILLLGTWGTPANHPLDIAMSAVAAAQGATFVPLASIYAVTSLHTGGDNWHPNDLGHARIAAAMLAAL